MEPRIQYAKTSDGMSIAFGVIGSGVPLVHAMVPLSHLLLVWRSPVWRPWLKVLADRYQLVLYDGRGNGMSQRGLKAYPPEAPMLDLEAVVNHLSLNRFFVFASFGHGHGALRFAAADPDRIAGLILWSSFVNGRALDPSVFITLAETNWDFFLQSLAQSGNWLETRYVRGYIDLLRQTMTQEDYLTFARGALGFDVEPLLPGVHTPALVLHPTEGALIKPQEAMRLASELPNARLVLLDGPSSIPTGGMVDPALLAVKEFINDFLAEGEPTATAPEPPPGTFRTVLFTDLVGHTEMMQRLGDERGREVLREHERITRELLKAHGGTEVKAMGDGFMASFGSVTKAVECAVALQRAFAEREGEPLSVRVGLNAGEPIEEDGDLFGATVILASRIAAKAEGNEILVADTVRGLCSGKGFLFADRGEFVAKGFEEPVRVYEVSWREEA